MCVGLIICSIQISIVYIQAFLASWKVAPLTVGVSSVNLRGRTVI